MKVGIVSLFGTFNFGNRLQNYAVQQLMKKRNYKTKVLFFQSDKELAIQLLRKLYYRSPLCLLLRASDKQKLFFARQMAFERFNKEFISTKRIRNIKRVPDFDYYVLGSDQVWNPKRYNKIKQNLFLLAFTEPKKKICFSPSFGVEKLPEKWKPYFQKQLSTFPHLSVREDAGARIIKDLTGREAEVLIDPTLMINKEDWIKLSKRPRNIQTDNSYILTYFIGGTPEKAKADMKRICQTFHVEQIYELMDPENYDLYKSGPQEFLYLINHAALILTDSFHAGVFSFIFEKPFLLYKRDRK